MSLLLLFQGGVQGTPAPPPPPPPPPEFLEFLSHGDPGIGVGAGLTVSGESALAMVGPGASPDSGGDAATTIIGPGGTTTIQ